MTIYKCHNWAFNPKNQELMYADGQVKQLPGRISACLNTLLECRGETVNYDQLLMKVWGTTHKDPSTVSSVISELRKLIGCGREQIKLLHTVPKKGYRFVGDVEVVGQAASNVAEDVSSRPSIADTLVQWQVAASTTAPQSAANNAQPPPVVSVSGATTKSWYSPKSLMLVLFGLLLSISASILSSNFLGFDGGVHGGSTGLFDQLNTLTQDAGSETEFDIDRSNQWLIYNKSRYEDITRIAVKNLSTGEVFEMPSEEGINYVSPSFSPDLSKVAYVRNSDKACEVWLIGFNQGQFDMSSNRRVSRCGLPGFWTTTDFSADGHSVYFARSESLDDPFRIYRHDLRTGYERNLTAPTSSGRGDYSFSVSPDGKKLAIVRNLLWLNTRILVKNLEDDSMTSVEEVPYLLERVAWHSNDELVYRGENWKLFGYDITNNKQRVIADFKQPLNFPLYNEDRLYAYRGLPKNASIWSVSLQGDNQPTLSKVINSPYLDFSPVLVSSLQMFFLSNRSGTTQLWHKENDRYTKYADPIFAKRVKSLNYSDKHQALFGVSQMRIFRYEPKQQHLEWLTEEGTPIRNVSLSDDGKLVYAVDVGEQWFLRIMDIDTKAVTSLDVDGFNGHLNDNILYYTRYRTPGLWKLDLQSGESKLLIDDFESMSASYWDVFGDKIFFAKQSILTILSIEDGRAIGEPHTLDGIVKNIQCYDYLDACLIDLFQNGETEVVELK